MKRFVIFLGLLTGSFQLALFLFGIYWGAVSTGQHNDGISCGIYYEPKYSLMPGLTYGVDVGFKLFGEFDWWMQRKVCYWFEQCLWERGEWISHGGPQDDYEKVCVNRKTPKDGSKPYEPEPEKEKAP